MNSPTIQFELVSPEKKLFSGKAVMVTLPGTEGDLGVLGGHAPLISTLRVGVIGVYENDVAVANRLYLVAGGLVEIQPERCTALAEDATPLDQIKRETLEADLRKAREVLSIAQEAEKEALHAKIVLLEKKLDVFTQASAH
ncbi:MAG: ATP synthase F1 subunit epsilon [Proteobacteria bacterium]|nr:ATP synthase F1 subunit epsilon [Pseudomonadota bacterium]